ncbi:hypothetical protein DYB32_004173 [Aphanomyces invadans]|uniref:GPI-anchored wall transfer protein 1 n=1 Tax=Aphanomyces invadans TaxID=157072 RepID=A0A3R6Z9A8_9STRA|nr:hypothetical protein DYB32_004173 [Aphanomyces invadans]
MAVDEAAYKKAKELFVSGHNGTSVGEVALVLSVLSADKKLARKDKLTFLMSSEKPAVTCFRAQMMTCTNISQRSLRLVVQEHVTEYGVHWNFYFTLASLYFTFSILALFGSYATSVPVALVLLAGSAPLAFTLDANVHTGYQVGLTKFGIQDYIFNAPRVDLFSQNREGIFSLCGYLPLYLLSVAIGQVIFSKTNANSRHVVRGDRWMIAKLFMIGFTAWGVSDLVSKHLTRPMAPRVPLIFAGISRNQLFVFLVANLMTGAVNLSMQTLYATPAVGFGIMVVYLFAVSVVAAVLDHFQIKVKL